jgi:protocatechuate 3,4-dioxygenase beta subunit
MAMCWMKTSVQFPTRWWNRQANACGRYVHVVDQHPAPLDPNFTGAGRAQSNAEGYYRFVTIKPGAYPWGNHHNAWRPAHIHFSVFGHSFVSRLVTQMYFRRSLFRSIRSSPGDRREGAQRMISFDLENTIDWRCATASTLRCAGGSHAEETDKTKDGITLRRPSARFRLRPAPNGYD